MSSLLEYGLYVSSVDLVLSGTVSVLDEFSLELRFSTTSSDDSSSVVPPTCTRSLGEAGLKT